MEAAGKGEEGREEEEEKGEGKRTTKRSRGPVASAAPGSPGPAS